MQWLARSALNSEFRYSSLERDRMRGRTVLVAAVLVVVLWAVVSAGPAPLEEDLLEEEEEEAEETLTRVERQGGRGNRGGGGRNINCNRRKNRDKEECQGNNNRPNRPNRGDRNDRPNRPGRRPNRPGRKPNKGKTGINCNRRQNRDLPECQADGPPSQDVEVLAGSVPWLTDVAAGGNVVELQGLPNTPRMQSRRYQLAVNQPDLPFQSCRTPRREKGFCRYLQHCILPEFVSGFTAYLPYACLIDSKYLGACCPTSFNSNNLQPSTPNPVTPAPTPRPTTPPSEARGCGLIAKPPPTRIVGGKPADPKEWPWIAALLRNGATQFCGGTLITNQHVLTAAHCIVDFTKESITVRLGEYTFDETGESPHVDFKIKTMKPHEHYDTNTYVNDIALITLDRTTDFNDAIWPVCLPQSDESYVGRDATVVGWGTIYFGGPVASTLQEVTIPVWTNEECNAAYEQDIIDKQICAGAREGGKDSCQGDSGGPLLLQQGGANRWAIAGVVSWGIRCAEPGNPGVYTRVSRYSQWIRNNAV
ncbi:proclotting enzyme-like isoform X7 [Portunus trituberculatus]|uniref:proclotting enzyme-like isoform X7 n=1 Tax=Portunus trituberculatus TaxID=210409 RepID=UPI001E1CB425|nr:proclotting enzyme-like isoform X7 [Portunus trituberculatus]